MDWRLCSLCNVNNGGSSGFPSPRSFSAQCGAFAKVMKAALAACCFAPKFRRSHEYDPAVYESVSRPSARHKESLSGLGFRV